MFLELSHNLTESIPVYPGSPVEKFVPCNRMSAGDFVNSSQITHYLHSGTHVDAPFHFDQHGKTIDELPIEDFVYDHPLVIDRKLNRSQLLKLEDLKPYERELRSADILFIHTGYGELRNQAAVYIDDFPAVSEEAAKFIRTELSSVKAVAIDTLSIESATQAPKHNFKVHKTFLDAGLYPTRPLLIYEDVNIGIMVGKKIRRIYAFPLRLKGLEASPVTIVAEVEP